METFQTVVYLSTVLFLLAVPALELLAPRPYPQRKQHVPTRPAPKSQVFVMPTPVIKVAPIPLKKAA